MTFHVMLLSVPAEREYFLFGKQLHQLFFFPSILPYIKSRENIESGTFIDQVKQLLSSP